MFLNVFYYNFDRYVKQLVNEIKLVGVYWATKLNSLCIIYLQTQCVIQAGALYFLGNLLRHKQANLVKEAAWTLSNITAGNAEQIQLVISGGLLTHLFNVLDTVSDILLSICYIHFGQLYAYELCWL